MNNSDRLALTGSIRAAHRRHRYGQAVARWIVALAVVALAAWFASEIAVAALLDERRLAMMGIVA